MKRFLLWLFFLVWGFSLEASPCLVRYPDDFLGQWQKLNAGDCQTLTFTATMEIYLDSPLQLRGSGAPVLMEPEEGKRVRFLGWTEGNKNPGITIRRSDVTIKNIGFKNFPGSALSLEGGRNISIIRCEISHGGQQGILINETEKVLIKKSNIHHNGGFGLVANGYQIEIVKTKVHHNTAGGLFMQAGGPGEKLHTFKLSKVSFYDNTIGIQTEGAILPAPRELVMEESGNSLTITGAIPFSRDEEDPWRLGIIHPREMEVEIYASDPNDPSQGKKYLATVEEISEEGEFEIEIPASDSRARKITAVAVDKVLKVSSPFSQKEEGEGDDNEPVPVEEEEQPDPTTADTDQDGLDDEEEEELGTDPLQCDSDQDGLGDGLEAGIVYTQASTPECRGLAVAESNFSALDRLDPLQSDSDNDDLKDGEEDKNRNGWIDSDETDPTEEDTDGDGLKDGFESRFDFDPRELSNGEGCSPPGDRNDMDCDGRINARDLDSDNDSCLDAEENRKDADENGIPDVWESGERGCTTSGASSSGPSSPSLDSGPGQEKEVEEKVFSETVTPSKGGGACQFVPKSVEYRAKSIGFWMIGFFTALFFILRLQQRDGGVLSKVPNRAKISPDLNPGREPRCGYSPGRR